MYQAIQHAANLTGLRDRQQIDATLAHAVMDVLQPRSVTITRLVGEAVDQRWVTFACVKSGSVAAVNDSLLLDINSLPPSKTFPGRCEALASQDCVSHPIVGDSGWSGVVTIFPLTNDLQDGAVVEIETNSEMLTRDKRIVVGLLRVYRNMEALLDHGQRDSLTGLLNRKTFDEEFMRVSLAGAQLATTEQQPVTFAAGGDVDRRLVPVLASHWLGIIDVDAFKQVNDSFGYVMGDEVLLLVARILRNTFRYHDRLYRFGGEEFVVLIRCPGATEAAAAFERLRNNVSSFTFPQVGELTVSVGYTQILTGDTPTAAFSRADEAIHYAKKHGRNQVRHYESSVQAGTIDAGCHR